MSHVSLYSVLLSLSLYGKCLVWALYAINVLERIKHNRKRQKESGSLVRYIGKLLCFDSQRSFMLVVTNFPSFSFWLSGCAYASYLLQLNCAIQTVFWTAKNLLVAQYLILMSSERGYSRDDRSGNGNKRRDSRESRSDRDTNYRRDVRVFPI